MWKWDSIYPESTTVFSPLTKGVESYHPCKKRDQSVSSQNQGWERVVNLHPATRLVDSKLNTHVVIEFVELGLEADTKNLSFDLSSLVS